jgi:hypothetical protein
MLLISYNYFVILPTWGNHIVIGKVRLIFMESISISLISTNYWGNIDSIRLIMIGKRGIQPLMALY